MQLLITWLALTLGLWICNAIIKGFRIEGGLGSFALIGALVGVLQFFFGWFLFGVIGIATLGIGFLLSSITRLIVTAIVLKLADGMSSRLEIEGFMPAFLSAFLLAVVGAGVNWVVP